MTRPGVLPTPLVGPLAAAQVAAVTAFYRVADETAHVTAELLTLIGHGLAFGKQIHDANIVATCIANNIPRLLTHNVADFKRYAPMLVVETALAATAPTPPFENTMRNHFPRSRIRRGERNDGGHQ